MRLICAARFPRGLDVVHFIRLVVVEGGELNLKEMIVEKKSGDDPRTDSLAAAAGPPSKKISQSHSYVNDLRACELFSWACMSARLYSSPILTNDTHPTEENNLQAGDIIYLSV